MFYSLSLIPFQFILHTSLIHLSSAISPVEDKMLIAFVRNDQKMQISEFTKQKYEAHLGMVNYMRTNWKCDKIAENFVEYERTECQKYRKYLDILYEYLKREYAGIPTVKPKFIFKGVIEIDGPIIYAVNCLARISQFYFIKKMGQEYEYNLNDLFIYYLEPKLLNENRLNYEIKLENEQKLSINEMILQLAIETANEWQTSESLNGIIKQNFNEFLRKMFKKAEETVKKDSPMIVNAINDDKHKIISESKFDDELTWTENALFSEFVKGLATNFEKFFKMAKEYSNYLYRKKEEGIIHWNDGERMIYLGLYEIEKMKKYLTQKYESHLGNMYLMRQNWQCDIIWNEFKEKCQTNRKYLDILYEYLFRLYAEAKNPKVSKQLQPLVKPIFSVDEFFANSLIYIVQKLSDNSQILSKNEKTLLRIELKNKEELNYQIKERENEQVWAEFEQKMGKICKKTKENANEEKKKLEKA